LLSRLSFLRPLSLGEGAVPISGQFKNRKRKDTYDSACQYKKLQIIVPLFLREKHQRLFFTGPVVSAVQFIIKLQTKSIFILSLF
jgi:hypothetical protein